MDYIEATVSFKSSKTNFVSLPSQVVSMLYNANINSADVICELAWTVTRSPLRVAYCGWSGYASTSSMNDSQNIVEIDPVLALSLQLTENTKVTINLKISDYNIAKTVELEPLATADWELVELNAGVLENNLLYQARCIAQDQIIVVYPGQTTNAKLKVLNFTPNDRKASSPVPFAKIVNDTEFHIKPKVMKKKDDTAGMPRSRKSNSSRSRSSREKPPHVLFRGIALPHPLYPQQTQGDNLKYEVYVNFEECMKKLQNTKYVHVSIVPGPDSENSKKAQTAHSAAATEETTLIESKSVVAKLIHSPHSLESHVGLSSMLAAALGVSKGVGYLVLLESSTRPLLKTPDTLIVHPYITESEPTAHTQKQINLKADAEIDRKSKEKNELALASSRLAQFIKAKGFFHQDCLTNQMRIPAIENELLPHGGLLEFGKIKEGWVDLLDINNTKIEIGSNIVRVLDNDSELKDLPKVVGQDKLLQKMVKVLKRCNAGSLLYGSSGSGKTVIRSAVSEKISSLGIHVELLNCETLSAEITVNVIKRFDDILKKISWHSPSLLILENCDLLIPSEQENSDNSNSRQIAEFLISKLLNKTMKKRKVGVLFTAKNKSSVNSILFSSHLIEETFNLKTPDKELRKIIIAHLCSETGLDSVDEEVLGDVSAETEGYLPGDLKILVDRAHYDFVSASIEQVSSDTTKNILTKQNFASALKGFTPSSLRGVKLQRSTVNWEDIGGLREAKSVLLETLEWPTKYAPIFKNCPLRLRSGILLYGYPGCGKTLLASAVASQCGLNFISIKGPEILNKYIGASEQSVRDLFDRAQAAKPCILFFDEFDSIAPKRGHDSTGVTDRVVNQMLTQMDGAEGLDGVYVLAATSRPDLIDSALLRPGRLDKSVICDIPDYHDRLDILKCISLKMDLDEDVDMNIIAEQTEGYSGADLQAVGYNAYLLGVHERLEKEEASLVGEVDQVNRLEFFQLNSDGKSFHSSMKDLRPTERLELVKRLESIFHNEDTKLKQKQKEEEQKQGSNKIVLRHEHFIKSLEDTKPSISMKEKLKLSAIYHQFLNPNERDGTMPDGKASSDIGGRSTLA